MKYDFNTQSKAVKEAKNITVKAMGYESGLSEQLECAAQTLAALNLTKDLPDREAYLDKIVGLTTELIEEPQVIFEKKLEQEILSMSYDELAKAHRRIEELEEALKNLLYTSDNIWQNEAKRIIHRK